MWGEVKVIGWGNGLKTREWRWFWMGEEVEAKVWVGYVEFEVFR